MTRLLDLQAKLRSEDAGWTSVTTAPSEVAPTPEVGDAPSPPVTHAGTDVLSIVEGGVTVSAGTGEDATQPEEEGDGASVTTLRPSSPPETSADQWVAELHQRLARLENDLDGVMDKIEDADYRRIQRLQAEGTAGDDQHRELKATIESHLNTLQQTVEERLRALEDED